ncbi:LacI family DNA-binding transcriptional regulator [Verminephrobacter aporrectodeae]|uniref:LacI family DNA-binding transcriptional regulator n=1 Tax=Verminephrobacter aporrectodeae TaxID=1110389 RepID=UPI002ADDEAF5|nr:LacI family DNA-binding transcriptional regulator [Verminephrobacter aporrectodeae]
MALQKLHATSASSPKPAHPRRRSFPCRREIGNTEAPAAKNMQQPPRARARLADVAHRAAVSVATADRVLHDRTGVRESTRKRVLEAAARLDYIPEGTLAKMLHPACTRLSFILPEGNNRFISLLAESALRAQEQLAAYNVQCKVRWVESFNAEALSKELLVQGRKSDGIAFIPLEHPLVRDATNHLVDSGVPVMTVASDLSNTRRTAYIGLDNYAAGRTAGLVLGKWSGGQAGQVVMICGSLSYRGHGERELGFQHLLQESFPELEITGVREGHDDPERTYQQTNELIAQHKRLVGIYNVGGGAEGVGRALKKAGLAGKVSFVGHELTPETRGFLIDATMAGVIHQNPQLEVMNCVRTLANLREGKKPQEGIEPLRIALIVRENLP